MVLEIYNNGKNYTATVIKLPVKQTVDGLDNLVKVTIFGNDCLIDKNADENDMYIFFPAESKLSSTFLSKNSLYRDTALNLNKNKKGFFEPNGRVKSIKFKGFISTGYIVNIESLNGIVDYSKIKIGDEFNSIDGVEICRKNIKTYQYENTEKSKRSKNERKLDIFDKLIPNQFRFHVDTYHLGKYIHMFNNDDLIISITDKWHGTSAVFSKVLVNKNLGWVEKLLIKLGVDLKTTEYDNLYSSRKVLKNRYINTDQTSYYDVDIWSMVNDNIHKNIEEGITLYCEIVGYLPNGKHIQKGYDYKCDNNKHKFFVYRITYTKPNGDVIEFSWEQIKEYCNKYSMEHAKEFFYGSLRELKTYLNVQDKTSNDELFMKILSSFNIEKDCKENNNIIPAEGIVVRIDGKGNYNAFKVKSKRFVKYETDLIDKNYDDIEEEN